MSPRALLVLALLVLPAAAGAGTWRWRDAAGRLHYSNIVSEVPAGAVELDVKDEPPGEWRIETILPPLPPRENRLPVMAGEDVRFG